MLRLDIRTKIIILLTISTSTFIVNTLWIEVLCVIILSGMQLAFGKKVFSKWLATVYKGNIIKNLIMDCQSYTKYRPNETTGGIFVSWRRKEELPTGA